MHFNRKTIAIVFNPKGGSAKSNTVNKLAELFRAEGLSVSLLTTTPEPGSATRLARQAAQDGVELVVPFGGDGTVCQVAEGLVGTQAVMAVYPGGTGNLFARSFYAVPTPKHFVSMVMTGNPQAVDMMRLEYTDLDGVAHVQHQLVALGLGKISDAISDASPLYKNRFKKVSYVIGVSFACLKPMAQKFDIRTPGSTFDGVASALMVFNVTPPVMSGLSRGCNAADGMLDVVIIRGTNTWHLLKSIACLVFGKPERSSHYFRFRTSELTVNATLPVKPNIDGDPGKPTRTLKVSAVPGAVRMILSH